MNLILSLVALAVGPLLYSLCRNYPAARSTLDGFLFVTIAGIVVVLTAIAIGTSAILIELFGTPDESNFWLNVAGVVVAAAGVVTILQKLRRFIRHRQQIFHGN